MMRVFLSSYEIFDKRVFLMRTATGYSVRCANYRSPNYGTDFSRTDFSDYAYTQFHGDLIDAVNAYYRECDYLTNVYGHLIGNKEYEYYGM